ARRPLRNPRQPAIRQWGSGRRPPRSREGRGDETGVKILLVNWQDPANPQAGGAEIHLVEIFRRLQAEGHAVTWLASGWKDASPEDSIDGLSIRRVGSRYT